jgi:hypothetical protein
MICDGNCDVLGYNLASSDNTREERGEYLLRGGSLKSRKMLCILRGLKVLYITIPTNAEVTNI